VKFFGIDAIYPSFIWRLPLSDLGPFALLFDAENMMQNDSWERRILMRRLNNSSVFATVASARRQCHTNIVAEAQILFSSEDGHRQR
jgi:hypothetical protein